MLKTTPLVSVFIAAISFNLSADTLTLNNGSVLEGTLLSRDAENIQFEMAGNAMTFSTSDVKDLDVSFTAPAKAEPAPVENSKAASAITHIPAGTPLMVSLDTAISSREHRSGHRFSGKLEGDLSVGGHLIAKTGDTVYGKVIQSEQAGRLAGKSSLSIALTDITINGQRIAIQTNSFNGLGDAQAKNTVKKTAGGAAIGGLINGSDGAKDGAKVGAGLALITRGGAVQIPANTLLEFHTSANVNI
ncbi:hypothetical protein [Agarivorans sp. Toyoura001]|uniref:hypothetical protein n=1 Tax=unclassified Agarivorans TaxID=2636026 RepID=UPI0010DFAFD8|nr:hypothetical protein [Agarivorans sp. Toyoura001]GDY26235.1 hypothetical protein AHAT_21250 [Agarivorans sp. Toyoura001]